MEDKSHKMPTISARRSRASRSSISSIVSSSSDSEESHRNSFQGLLNSSLPSNSRTSPSLLPYHGQKLRSLRRRFTKRLVFKTLLAFVGLGLFFGMVLRELQTPRQHFEINYLSSHGDELKMISNNTMPESPMPVIIKDKEGKTRWTVCIHDSLDFPLKPSVYTGICDQSDSVAKHLMKMNKSHGHRRLTKRHMGYYQEDENFMDVEDAEAQGLLPNHKKKKFSWSSKAAVGQPGQDSASDKQNKICERSLTYVLETAGAGFGSTLMGLWMAYGLALEEDRDFFIEDKYWAYGKYSDYFRPIPKPSCLPPPEHHRLPCPHQARHLLISSATTTWAFGHQFVEEYEDPKGMEVMRQANIFGLLRAGYEDLFHLVDPDAEYLNKRLHELDSQIRAQSGIIVGVHVRHGDRHPLEFKYQRSYIPLEHYADAAQKLIANPYSIKNGSKPTHLSETASRTVLASDDPDVYNSSTFSSAISAQEMILLASKSPLDASHPSLPNSPFADENISWEGGFFTDVFWGLGSSSKSLGSPQERDELLEDQRRKPPSERTIQLRKFVGRAYLMDLAVLGQADRVVCAVSSIACRLLAVMMGWERAILDGGWKNVDGDFDWRGIVW